MGGPSTKTRFFLYVWDRCTYEYTCIQLHPYSSFLSFFFLYSSIPYYFHRSSCHLRCAGPLLIFIILPSLPSLFVITVSIMLLYCSIILSLRYERHVAYAVSCSLHGINYVGSRKIRNTLCNRCMFSFFLPTS